MKVLSSLKSAKARHRDCQVVKRRGRIFVICKSNPRFKAVQGKAKKKNSVLLLLSKEAAQVGKPLFIYQNLITRSVGKKSYQPFTMPPWKISFAAVYTASD